VLHGRADESLLETYTVEREAAADEHLAVTGATMRFMVPAADEDRRYRDGVLARARTDPSGRGLVDSGKLYVPAPYLGSPLTVASPDEPANGAPGSARPGTARPGYLVPDGLVDRQGTTTTLRTLLAGQLTLLGVPGYEGGTDPAPGKLATVLAGVQLPGLKIAVLCPGAEKAALPPGVDVIADGQDGAVWRACADPADQVLLIRPDVYVCAMAAATDVDRLVAAVAGRLRLLASPSPSPPTSTTDRSTR
jgi:3-(3-hydroxy-phenyl)propionate hydroxylase